MWRRFVCFPRVEVGLEKVCVEFPLEDMDMQMVENGHLIVGSLVWKRYGTVVNTLKDAFNTMSPILKT